MFKKSCSIILLCLLCIATAWANTATVSVKYNDAVIADYASGFNVEVWENGTKTGNGVKNTDGTYTVNFAADSCQVKVEDGNSSLPVYYLKSAASTSSVKNGDSVTADMGKLAYLSGSMPVTVNGTVVLSEDGIVAAPGCASVSVSEGYKLYTTPVSGYKLYYMDADANLTEVTEAISGDFTSNSITLAEGDNKTANIGRVVQKGTISVTVTGLPSGASMPTVSANGTALNNLTGDFAPGSYTLTVGSVTVGNDTYVLDSYTPNPVDVTAGGTANVTVTMKKDEIVVNNGTIEVSVTGLPDGADNPTVKIGDTELSYNSETKKYSGSFAPGTDYVLTVSAVTVDEDTYAATSQTPENPLTVVSDQTTSVEVSMEKAEGIKVTFNVTFENDGKPCNNAVVELVQGSDDPYAASLTDKAGEYVVFVPEGTYTVSVSNADADPATSIAPELDSNGQYSVTEDVTFDVVVPGSGPDTHTVTFVGNPADCEFTVNNSNEKKFTVNDGENFNYTVAGVGDWTIVSVNGDTSLSGTIENITDDITVPVTGTNGGGDHIVIFKVYRTNVEKIAKGVRVNFNGESKLTDENGEAVFYLEGLGDFATTFVPWPTYSIESVTVNGEPVEVNEDNSYTVNVNVAGPETFVDVDMQGNVLEGYAYDNKTDEVLANFTFFVGNTQFTTNENGYFRQQINKGENYVVSAPDGYKVISPDKVSVNGLTTVPKIYFEKDLPKFTFSGTVSNALRNGKVPYYKHIDLANIVFDPETHLPVYSYAPILLAYNLETGESTPIEIMPVAGSELGVVNNRLSGGSRNRHGNGSSSSSALGMSSCSTISFSAELEQGTYEIYFCNCDYYDGYYEITSGNTTVTIGNAPVEENYKIQATERIHADK